MQTKLDKKVELKLEELFQKWAKQKAVCKHCYPAEELMALIKNAVMETILDIERARVSLVEGRLEREEN